ncbi:hypothetical protein GCM10009838_76110 [Catenulispora subtropica]|uniref:Ricin B lectin n=1 Tax=Catenulispora subtropica TaxID=450798 RepID=A0ABP5ELC8_9ACTN
MAAISSDAPAAAAKAKATGASVAIASQTTETKQLLANPNGTFTSKSWAHPVRVKQNGAWADIDTTLVRRPDGTLAPKASVSTAVFSGGGPGPAVTLAHGADTVALSLPMSLPAPRLAGSTATYADVLPGVDLQLTATTESYSEVLVVHDEKAAANPALRSLRLTLATKGLSAKANKDSSIDLLDAAGTAVLHAPAPVMWDSRDLPQVGPVPSAADPGSGVVTPLTVAPAADPGPDAKARAAAPETGQKSVDLLLTPPASALTGTDVKYPLYIDPYFSGHDWGSQGYFITVGDDGSSDNSTNDLALVGYCYWPDHGSCNTRHRSYFRMDTSLYGPSRNGYKALVFDAWFYTTQVYDASCASQPTNLWEAGWIDGNTRWPGPVGGYLDQQSSDGGGNSQCAKDPSYPRFNAIGAADDAVNNGWGSVGLLLAAADENSKYQWKKFWANPELDVDFGYPPAMSGNMMVNNGNVVDCDGTQYVGNGANTNIPVAAQAYDNNPNHLPLKFWYEVFSGSNGSGGRVSWNYNYAPVQVDTDGNGWAYATWQSNYGTYPNGAYSFRSTVETVDPDTNARPVWANNGAWGDSDGNYSDSISRSGWKNFTVLAENMPNPGVSSYDFPHDANGNGQWGAPQGYGGTFTLTNAGNANTVGYSYGFDTGGSTYGLTSSTCTYNAVNGNTGLVQAFGDTSGSAIVPVPAGLGFGHHTLYVKSFDAAHNVSAGTTAYEFFVAPTIGGYRTSNFTGPITDAALNKCVDDYGGATANGSKVNVFDCNGSAAQSWTLAADGTIRLTGANSGICLDIPGPADTPGTQWQLLQVWACDAQAHQQWRAQSNGQGGMQIVNPQSGLCLDDPNAATANGTQLELYACNATGAQQWAVDTNPNRYAAFDPSQVAVSTSPSTVSTWTVQQTPDYGVDWAGSNQLDFGSTAVGDKLNLTVNAPFEADYALGVDLTKSYQYGQFTFWLDGKLVGPYNSANPFDAYSAHCCSTVYVPLGGQHLTAGKHTLSITTVGRNTADTASTNGVPDYYLGIDYLMLAPVNAPTYPNFGAAQNNHGISDDTDPAAGNLDFGGAPGQNDVGGTGTGGSLSAQTLAAAGLSPGTSFTMSGISFTMPQANAAGNDNVVAHGQTITLDASQQVPADAVGLLVAATCGGTPESSATLTYKSGLAPGFDKPIVPPVADWSRGTDQTAAFTLPYRNRAGGAKDTSTAPRLYLVVLPANPASVLSSITLPYYGTTSLPGTCPMALHVLAVGVRPAATANLTSSKDVSGNGHDLGVWGNPGFTLDRGGAAVFSATPGQVAKTTSAVLDTTKSFSVSAWVKPASLPAGVWQTMVVQQGTNASGFYLEYDAALNRWGFDRSNADTANPAGSGAKSLAAPALNTWTHLTGVYDSTAGTLALYVNGVLQNTASYSAAMPSNGVFAIGRGFWNGQNCNNFNGSIDGVQAFQRALTAADISALSNGGTVANAAGSWPLNDFGRDWIGAWAAAPDSGTASPPGGAHFANQTLRQIVRPSTLGTAASGTVQVRVRLSNKYGTAPLTVTAATVAAQLGTAGAATGAPKPLTFGGPSAATVTIGAGMEVFSDPVDLPDTTVAGATGNLAVTLYLGTAVASVPTHKAATTPGYLATGNQSADTAGAAATWATALPDWYIVSTVDVTSTAQDANGALQGTVAVLGDRDSAAGAPATWVDGLQSAVGASGSASPGGFVNLSGGGQLTAAGAANSLNQRLHNWWRLQDGTGTTGADVIGNAPLILAGSAAWSTAHPAPSGPDSGPTTGSLSLNGTTDYASVPATPIDTSQSFTVSAWANVAQLTAGNHELVSTEGATTASFMVGYSGVTTGSTTSGAWWVFMPYSDGNNPGGTIIQAPANSVQPGLWTHVTATYDAAAKVVKLYVNGVQAATASNVTGFKATGQLSVGRSKWNGVPCDFWQGGIADVHVFQNALSGTEVGVLQAGGGADTQASNLLNATVLDQANLRTVVLGLGANDLALGDTAGTVETNLKALINSLRYGLTQYKGHDGTYSVKVILTTVAPQGWAASDPREIQRLQLNKDLVAGGLSWNAVGVEDVATVVAAPGSPNTVNPAYLTGGKPNAAYYTAVANDVVTTQMTNF